MAKTSYLVAVVLFFWCSIAQQHARPRFIIFNVGQGQWSVLQAHEQCWHFDVGGEIFPKSRFLKACQNRLNLVFLSHWDWDHIGLLGKMQKMLPRICLYNLPPGKSSPSKTKLLQSLPVCKNLKKLPQLSFEIYTPKPPHLKKAKRSASNQSSQVFTLAKLILLPGDSPSGMEKLWSQQLSLNPIKTLVLGHHGSKTSTGDFLLDHLPHLKMGVASARKARYGHPHPAIVARLKKRRISLLTTETWNHIVFELDLRNRF